MPEISATVADIAAAYRLLLNRDPDLSGLQHHLERLFKSGLNTRHLCAEFMRSDEYRNRVHLTEVSNDSGITVFVDETEPEFGSTIAQTKTWEPHLVNVIQSNLRSGQCFVDVGANIGVMALSAAQIVGPSGKVIAFEPNDENAVCLLMGVKSNGFEDVVSVYRFALSDKPAVFGLSGSSNTHLVPPRGARIAQALRGDDILQPEMHVHFIKLDIEGFEPFALRGLRNTLWKNKPLVLCEYNPRCLEDHADIPHRLFAEEIFELAHQVEVIESSSRSSIVRSASELTDLWELRDQTASEQGLLPVGMTHFDLLFQVS